MIKIISNITDKVSVRMKNVFIIGSKGIPANYGGYETFVENLTKRKITKDIFYHVACLAKDNNETIYNDARCFDVKVPNLGPAKAVIYDVFAIKHILKYIKANNIKEATLLILACRIGIVFRRYVKKLHKAGVRVIINPDGHEWKRSKWPWIVKKYWKFSEKKMVKYADRIICDSVNIEKYIQSEYAKYKPNTCYVSYGAEVPKLTPTTKKAIEWFDKFSINPNEYYLVVGRFVPENNYELMIRDFMKSNTKKDLVIITNKNESLYNKLLKKTHFDKDSRIKFVGTVYDADLLNQIRTNAFAYIHGHSVGGTNPSLLEALATTKLSILFDVSFNKEVGADAAFYFDATDNTLDKVIKEVEKLDNKSIQAYGIKAKDTIINRFSWDFICKGYERELYEQENYIG